MEEITKRFEIVRLAVQLGDVRTIEIQCDALRSLSLNEELDEIIELLESRNYRQALYEMKHYTEKVKDEFFEVEAPKAQSPKGAQRASDRAMAGLFDLEPVAETPSREERVLDVEDLLRLSRENRKSTVKEYVPAPTFDLETEEVESEEKATETAAAPQQGSVVSESESDIQVSQEENENVTEESAESRQVEEPAPAEELSSEEPVASPIVERESEAQKVVEEKAASISSSQTAPPGQAGEERYAPIPYIGQKFRNMIHQFPPVEEAERVPAVVEEMQKKIAREGYSESEIEAFLNHYRRYKEEGRKGEAALVLLLAAATESQFAQFLLARELFKGEIIEEDHAEAFTQINTLADQNFPEAICDLAQFYEHGVGIGKDRQLALLLYEEAAEMGVARAARHYQRLKNSRGLKGLLGKVKLPDLPLKLPKKS
ncbi:SEL1-like repeat protein [Nitratifractor salsuginis]|uniref:beta-lactamase n=1 Tax=Nitratifractor salsuginis (strain DSM 16511 / JCM 12458 / E9I37-1) TaxID=749222 RepID=E6WZP8_NITSE|nr:SEL1-like repeat protein [Nitratifractor salsuginis]ADV46689.1 hypothetical protein Nitsa_1440 [Nitratifractor salsuginis DSM 16511]